MDSELQQWSRIWKQADIDLGALNRRSAGAARKESVGLGALLGIGALSAAMSVAESLQGADEVGWARLLVIWFLTGCVFGIAWVVRRRINRDESILGETPLTGIETMLQVRRRQLAWYSPWASVAIGAMALVVVAVAGVFHGARAALFHAVLVALPIALLAPFHFRLRRPILEDIEALEGILAELREG